MPKQLKWTFSCYLGYIATSFGISMKDLMPSEYLPLFGLSLKGAKSQAYQNRVLQSC